jgi:iron complex outermembrane receptor protein
MRKLYVPFLTITLIFTAAIAAAQTGSVSGKVLDNNQAPLAAATIAILKQSDSSSIAMKATDKSGRFLVSGLPAGRFFLQVSATGHQTVYSKSFDISSNSTDIELPVITLTASSKELGSVTVVATRPAVEQKIDRTVVNVDATISNIGTNALDVLEKSPGVQVDKDGNISLKGKQGVMVLIDGRPSYLSAADLANMLRGMQSSQLDQIEIMTNPPAKYDASGNSGVINIKTRKNKARGLNGSVNLGAGQGKYFKTWESISLNYRDAKFNLFANYGFDRTINFQQLDIHRDYWNEGHTQMSGMIDQLSYNRRKFANHNLKLGLDIFLSKATTVGFVLSGFTNDRKFTGTNTSWLKNAAGVLDSTVYADSDTKERWTNGSVNLNLRHQFDTSGRELTIDLDYIRYDASNDQLFLNTSRNTAGELMNEEYLKGDLPADITIRTAKFDYTHPLSKSTRFEAGAKTGYVTNDSKANYFNGSKNGHGVHYITDYDKTNFFDYKENINAAYINFNHKFNDKWGVQTGLRYENTNYKGFQYGNPSKTDSAFTNSYNSLFPTFYLSYAPVKKHQFGISFGRRIDRPAYQDMNPFMFFIDKYTYGRGNPFLRPQYSSNFELNHIFNGILTTSLQYSETRDVMNELFQQARGGNGKDSLATIVTRGNIGKKKFIGGSMNLQWKVTKWYSTNVNINYGYNEYKGWNGGTEINISRANLFAKINNQFRFEKGWSAEISGWWSSRQVEGQIMIEPMGRVDAAIGKQILDNKGTIKLSVRDLFFTQIVKGKMSFNDTDASFRNTRDNRVVSINFSYRFGKQMSNNQRKRSSNEEQNRVRTGD